jgi:YNFM family putative membrane transporter
MTGALLGFAFSGLLPEGDPGRTLRRAMWLIVASSAVAALSPLFVVLLAARAGQGIGVGLLIAGGLADIARNHPASRGGRLTGLMIGGTAIGGLLSRLTGYSALWLGWRAAFALGGAVAIGFLSVALNRLAGPVGETEARRQVVSPREGGGVPYGLVLAGLGILFVNIAVFDLLPYRLAGPPFHLPAAIGDLVYLAFAPAVLATGVAGRAIDRFGARAVAVATVAIGVACLLVGLLPSLLAVAVMAIGSVSGTMVLHTCHSGAAAARSRVAVGRYLAAYYVGGAAAAPLVAVAYQALGWVGAVLPLCLAWAGVGLLAALRPASRWRRESGPGSQPPEPVPAAP